MRGQMKNASSIHDNCFGKVIFHVSVLRYFECNDQHGNYIVKLRENGVSFHKLMMQNIKTKRFNVQSNYRNQSMKASKKHNQLELGL